MKVPSEFDDIRPYEPEELPMVFNRLLSNNQFCAVLTNVMSGIAFAMLKQTSLTWSPGYGCQNRHCYQFL